MAKVFVIQDDGKRDFSQAMRFGELNPIIGRDVFPDEADERAEAVANIIARRLSYNFNPDKDFILLTGDPVAILAVGVWLGAVYPDKDLSLLKYDGENKDYFKVVLKP